MILAVPVISVLRTAARNLCSLSNLMNFCSETESAAIAPPKLVPESAIRSAITCGCKVSQEIAFCVSEDISEFSRVTIVASVKLGQARWLQSGSGLSGRLRREGTEWRDFFEPPGARSPCAAGTPVSGSPPLSRPAAKCARPARRAFPARPVFRLQIGACRK